MQRRRAIQLLGSLSGLPALTLLDRSPGELLALGTRIHEHLAEGPATGVLTPAQHRIVTVAAEHIIPRTDTPGATDARVADFADVMLAEWYAPAERDRFLAGLTALDANALREHGRAFAEAPAAGRVALLTTMDRDVAALRQTSPAAADQHWFAMLKFLTVWGWCTSRVGITDGLKQQLMPGYYDGDAPLAGVTPGSDAETGDG